MIIYLNNSINKIKIQKIDEDNGEYIDTGECETINKYEVE